jgi:uncharacterized protein YaeQ
MALRATIYKAQLNVADTDRHYYGSHALTIARHPSETDLRMMLRVLAFAWHASEQLTFTKGLSETDEPDLWEKDLTHAINLWIEVGHPDERRLKTACSRASQVVVYCYGGHASQIWWQGVKGKLARLSNLSVLAVPVQSAQSLSLLATRAMQLNVNISDQVAYVSSASGEVMLEPAIWC